MFRHSNAEASSLGHDLRMQVYFTWPTRLYLHITWPSCSVLCLASFLDSTCIRPSPPPVPNIYTPLNIPPIVKTSALTLAMIHGPNRTMTRAPEYLSPQRSCVWPMPYRYRCMSQGRGNEALISHMSRFRMCWWTPIPPLTTIHRPLQSMNFHDPKSI